MPDSAWGQSYNLCPNNLSHCHLHALQVCLPHEVKHCPMLKQPRVLVSDVLQALTFNTRWYSSPGWPTWQT